MRVLGKLRPEKVFYYFEEICKIPHGSGNMTAISEYCVKFGKERDLPVVKDEMGNVIMSKKASKGYENEPGIILQGHMDMVCESDKEKAIDFEKDSISIVTNRESIWADGTTLGADDGIAVAYILAIFDSDDIEHPPLEAILTVDEEIGLLGAGGIDLTEIKGRKLINLDSEEEGVVITSCAGGATLACKIPLMFERAEGVVCSVTVSGLFGGHSGSEINRWGANSNQLAGRILEKLIRKADVRIADVFGGTKTNVIPILTTITIVADKEKRALIIKCIEELEQMLRKEFAGKDDDLQVSFEERKHDTIKVLNDKSQQTLICALMNMPNGIQNMSADVEGMIETSLNLGVVNILQEKSDLGVLEMKFAVRSTKKSALAYLNRRCIVLAESFGGEGEVSGVYSAWEYDKKSVLRNDFVKVYKELYKKEPLCEGVHGGLECGMFRGKIPDLDCISIGPDMKNVHTTKEILYVESVKRTWELLIKLLAIKHS